jgi:hypothetical protein
LATQLIQHPAMAWHYEQNGQSVGPITPAQLADLVRQGTVTPETLVWQEGMANWQPYKTLLPLVAAPAPPAPGEFVCAECGRSFPPSEVIAFDKFHVCAACKPVFFQRIREGTRPAGTMLWRSAKVLVMTPEAQLPDRCVKCNAPAAGRRLKRRLYWHHPAVYLLILCSLLIYVIVAIVIRKRAVIDIGLCERHFARRKLNLWISWMMALGGVVSIVAAIAYNNGWLGLTGGVLLLAAAIYGLATTQMVSAKRIDQNHVWVRGACREFLDTLPAWPGD